MPKLCPHIIVEGTRLTGKTELLRALTTCPDLVGERKYWYHSPLVSAEWSSISREPWGENLIDYPPEREPLVLDVYDAWVRVMELAPHDAWFADRFHLSTIACQKSKHSRDVDLWQIDERLAALGFVTVLCTRDSAGFEAARIDRLEVSGKPSQYNDLAIFEREQDSLRDACERSRIPVIEVEIISGDEAKLAEQIAGAVAELGLLEST